MYKHTDVFTSFVSLAFGLKGHQDILEGKKEQKGHPAREEAGAGGSHSPTSLGNLKGRCLKSAASQGL
jgi:hypothetical protein